MNYVGISITKKIKHKNSLIPHFKKIISFYKWKMEHLKSYFLVHLQSTAIYEVSSHLEARAILGSSTFAENDNQELY